MIRRINLVAGPSAGKSKTAMRLASDLKGENKSVEYVVEIIKEWAFLKREPKEFDQLFIFGSQLHAENVKLYSGVKYVVTDSPVFMQCAYAKKHGFVGWHDLYSLASKFEEQYPSITIFLDRSGLKYEENGRYHTEQQALEIDQEIKQFLDDFSIPYVVRKTVDYEDIFKLVSNLID